VHRKLVPVAIALMAVVSVGWMLARHHIVGSGEDVPLVAEVRRSVATLKRSVGATWESGVLSAGVQFPAGLLQLTQGLVELEFEGGVTAVVKGPASIEL